MKNGSKRECECHLFRHRKLLTILVTISLSLTQVLTLPVIAPKIDQKLQTTNEATIVITFLNSQVDKILEPYAPDKPDKFPSHGARITAIHKELTEHADQLHSATLKVINGIQRPAQSPYILVQMWPSGELVVRNADKALMQELSKSNEIENIALSEKRKIVLPEKPIMVKNNDMQRQGVHSWGVTSMGFRKIWDKGNKGKGVVVGVIDTGVYLNHETLRDSWRSEYGWYEPMHFSKQPYDISYHGTAVASIAVGKGGVGCAPEAQWIACLAIRNESTDGYTFNECLKFMNCPTDTDGKNPRCDLAPKVIVASIGYPNFRDRIQDHDKHLKALRHSKISLIFANGNGGGQCGNAWYPGSSDLVIGVGNSQRDFTVNPRLSSCGPPFFNKALIKPDVVAPGTSILAASSIQNNSPDQYGLLTGTSIATPHVAGLAALYYHDFPNATTQEFETLLRIHSRTNIKPNGLNLKCGDITEKVFPNHIAGYGFVDAHFIMEKAHGRSSATNHLLQFELMILAVAIEAGIVATLSLCNSYRNN